MTKKVAIVGYTSTKDLVPWDDNSVIVWGLNDLYDQIPRYNRWFEMHSRGPLIDGWKSSRTNRNHLEVLQQMQCPIYMQQKHEDIPNSVAYPLQEMLDQFGNYFTNSISYMLALAIYEGYEEIQMYGVDMAVGTEYSQQRPSCEYFIGVAIGRGINVHIPEASDLLKARCLYGYEQEKEEAFIAKLKQVQTDIDGKMQFSAGQELAHRDNKNQYIGAKNAISEMLQVWGIQK